MAEKTSEAAPRPAGNGYDPEVVSSYVDRCENLDAEIEKHHMAYMREKQILLKDKKDVIDEAKDAHGIPKKELRHILKERAMRRRLESLDDDLEPDQVDTVDQLRQALGMLDGLPLGDAAVEREQAA